MAKQFKWKRVFHREFIAIKGDVMTLGRTKPEEIASGDSRNGYIIIGFAGHTVGYILDDYDQMDHPIYWTKVPLYDPSIPRRLVTNAGLSKPLPLP